MGCVAIAMVSAFSGVAHGKDFGDNTVRVEHVVQKFDQGNAQLAQEYGKKLSEGMKILFGKVLLRDGSGIYYVDKTAASQYASEVSLGTLQTLANNLNNSGERTGEARPASWGSFGECVVNGVLGFSIFGIDYEKLGQYVKQRLWDKVVDMLKKKAEEELKKQGAKLAFKQVLKLTPVGLAASAAVYVTGCAAKEGWKWLWG